MTQVDAPMELVQDTEAQLWTAYVVAAMRRDEARKFRDEAWRNYVLTGLRDPVKGGVWDYALNMSVTAREYAEEARNAWERAAYPLHGIPLSDDEGKMSS